MKIGILTHHYINNYGAFLQGYALQEAVKKLYPNDEVYMINFINRKHDIKNTLGWYRYNPKKDSMKSYIQKTKLPKIFKDFQNKYGEVRALIFGGRESSFIDPHCPTQSNEVSATMCDVLSTRCNIPDENFASIMGKFAKVKTNDNMAVIGDKVYLANKEFEKSGLLNASDDKVEALAGKVYEDVFIPKNFLV